jgi:hypothetical protein
MTDRTDVFSMSGTDDGIDVRAVLTEFLGFLSTHPDLHVITTDGLLQNHFGFAMKLVDQFMQPAHQPSRTEANPASEKSEIDACDRDLLLKYLPENETRVAELVAALRFALTGRGTPSDA